MCSGLQAMFVENALLLLAGSDFFSVATWDSMGIPAAVFCSFLIGEKDPDVMKFTLLHCLCSTSLSV